MAYENHLIAHVWKSYLFVAFQGHEHNMVQMEI